jgi:hypothetical protein
VDVENGSGKKPDGETKLLPKIWKENVEVANDVRKVNLAKGLSPEGMEGVMNCNWLEARWMNE